jgi:hypothetical protein
VELGVKFRSDVAGTVTGVRFYKLNIDNTVHTGSLWSSAGTLLATGTFTTAAGSQGWQQLTFASPAAINANTTYIASFHSTGGYYATANAFVSAGVDNGQLHALKQGVDGSNGVYAVGSGPVFPNQSFNSTNYWADVVFVPSSGPQAVTVFSGNSQLATTSSSFVSALQAKVTDGLSNPVSGVAVTFTAPASGASATFGGSTSVTVNTNSAGVATSPIPVANSTAGSYSVTASVAGIATPATFTLTNFAGALTIFGTTAPTTFFADSTPVEVGMKFRSDVNGMVTGVRFYKGAGDSTVHTGTLWAANGTLLATGTFTGGTASGWQQLNFAAPVAITANTTYVVSTHSGGPYYSSSNFFQSVGVDNGPLHALKEGIDGSNGVYKYGATTVFPNLSFNSPNYWVDVVFVP